MVSIKFKHSNASWIVMEWHLMLLHSLPLAVHNLLIMYKPVVYVPCGDVTKFAVGIELHEDEFKDRRSISSSSNCYHHETGEYVTSC